MRKRVFIISLVLLCLAMVVFNVVILNQNQQLQRELHKLALEKKNPPELLLMRLSASYYPYCGPPPKPGEEPGEPPPLSMLVFLSRNDCGACLKEAEIWEKLYNKYASRGFHISAVVLKEDYDWALDFAKEFDLSFRISPTEPILRQVLGIPPVTPFKVMVDSLHRVVWLSGPNSELEEQKNFAEVAEKLCRAYLEP